MFIHNILDTKIRCGIFFISGLIFLVKYQYSEGTGRSFALAVTAVRQRSVSTGKTTNQKNTAYENENHHHSYWKSPRAAICRPIFDASSAGLRREERGSSGRPREPAGRRHATFDPLSATAGEVESSAPEEFYQEPRGRFSYLSLAFLGPAC